MGGGGGGEKERETKGRVEEKSRCLGGEHTGSIIRIMRVSARRAIPMTLSVPADRHCARCLATLGQSSRTPAAWLL